MVDWVLPAATINQCCLALEGSFVFLWLLGFFILWKILKKTPKPSEEAVYPDQTI